MTKLEIPEGYLPVPWTATKTPEGYELFDSHSRSFGFIKNPNTQTRDLVLLAPAMAEEIKRLRGELSVAKGSEKAHKDFAGQLQSAIKSLEAEIASQKPLPATREDRAFQCYVGLLASPNKSTKDVDVHVADAILAADRMIAALAKPQGAQEPEKMEGGV